MRISAFFWAPLSCILVPTNLLLLLLMVVDGGEALKKCYDLRMAQYRCEEPPVSSLTQQPIGCKEDNSLIVTCEVAPGIRCDGLDNTTRRFKMKIANGCIYTSNYYSYNTALVLSFFTGILGGDRFYLGYYAMGLVKLFSCGGFFILWILDLILIILQRLGPADGSSFRMDYYGPRMIATHFSNLTYVAEYTCFNCRDASDVTTTRLKGEF